MKTRKRAITFAVIGFLIAAGPGNATAAQTLQSIAIATAAAGQSGYIAALIDAKGIAGKYGLKKTSEIKPAPDTELAWIGTNPWVQKWIPQFKLRLYRTTFLNPRPTETISSFDYVSNQAGNAAPFLVAVTVE